MMLESPASSGTVVADVDSTVRSPGQAETMGERAWRLLGGVSLRTKVMGILIGLAVALGVGITYQVRSLSRVVMVAEIDRAGSALANDLVAELARVPGAAGLAPLADAVRRNHDDVAAVAFLTRSGRVIASPTDTPWIDLNAPLSQKASATNHEHLDVNGSRIHRFGAASDHPEIAGVVVALTERRVDTIVDLITSQYLLTTGILSLVAMGTASALAWLLTRPILALSAVAGRIAGGDTRARAQPWANDEVGDLARSFNQMVEELVTSKQAIEDKERARTQLVAKLIDSQEEERKRIARELHDSVGQMLASILVGLSVIERETRPDEAAMRHAELRKLVDESVALVRGLSRQLRASPLDEYGLEQAIERFLDECRQFYAPIAFDYHSMPCQLSAPAETALYRIVQEAVVNAARHGAPSAVSVSVGPYRDAARAIIEDDGHGFDVEQARHSGGANGLFAMAERAEILGGRLIIESGSEGTTVCVEIPIDQDPRVDR